MKFTWTTIFIFWTKVRDIGLGRSRLVRKLLLSKKIVDEFLEKGYKKGMSFNELYEGYTGFGEDPVIISSDKHVFFSLDLCQKTLHRTLQ
jgi:hypothetical protein